MCHPSIQYLRPVYELYLKEKKKKEKKSENMIALWCVVVCCGALWCVWYGMRYCVFALAYTVRCVCVFIGVFCKVFTWLKYDKIMLLVMME